MRTVKKSLQASLLLFAILFGGVTLVAQTPRPSPTNGAGAGGGGGGATPVGATVTFSATPVFTCTSAIQYFTITLTGNVTSSTLSGCSGTANAPYELHFNIIQDGTGSRTFAWPTGFSEACTVTPTASIGTKQMFYWDGSVAHAAGPCITTAATSNLVLNIASGTAAMGTGAIASATCATAVTVGATGVATTDVISAGFNGDPTAITGYIPLTAGMLTIIGYPTANNVNFKVCNNTTSSITPGALTLNWLVAR